MIIDLYDECLQLLDDSEIERKLSDEVVTIQVPLPSINVSNSYIDVISDYLDASFVIETLLNRFKKKSFCKSWGVKHYPVYQLELEGYDKSQLASELKRLIWAFQSPEVQEDEADYLNLREQINEYEERLTELDFRVPEIVDDYFANLVNGAYYELDYDAIEAQLANFPERKYGYWSGAEYNNSVTKTLLSTHSWIVPKNHNIEVFLGAHGYGEQLSLLPAHMLMLNHESVAISEGGVLHVPMGKVIQALACFEEHSARGCEYFQRLDLDGKFFEFSPEITSLKERYRNGFWREASLYKVYVSEFMDFAVIMTELANIVVFDVSEIGRNESKRFLDAAKNLLSAFEDELVTEAEVDMNWNQFDDEKFEQLGYDVIYHNSKFDRSTIRKMGKSKSRDGGRDIVVYTKPKAGERPLKYIFQCKFSSRNQSINTSNVGSVSDVIDQYGAEGYGLICNCYIDSALYDRLDGISKNREIAIESWSGFEIERFLSRRPLLRSRYQTA